MRYALHRASHLYLPGFVFLALLLASCDSSSSDTEADSDPLFPLSVGNAWVFEITDNVGTAEPNVYLDTARVARDTLVGEERWYELSSRWGFGLAGALNSTDWYALREDGLWRLDADRRPVMVIEYPSDVGSTTGPRPGISYTRIAEDSVLTLEGFGAVRTIPYAVRFHDGFQVSDNLGATYVLRGDTTVIYHFSSEFGFVRIGGLWARLDSQDRLVPIGSQIRRLVEFIPDIDASIGSTPKRDVRAARKTADQVILN